MAVKDDIHTKLQTMFSPSRLYVIDESHLHAGHAGAREGGNSHFRVTIVSAAFAGKTRLAQHRAINDCLREELENGVHALAIEASAQL